MEIIKRQKSINLLQGVSDYNYQWPKNIHMTFGYYPNQMAISIENILGYIWRRSYVLRVRADCPTLWDSEAFLTVCNAFFLCSLRTGMKISGLSPGIQNTKRRYYKSIT